MLNYYHNKTIKNKVRTAMYKQLDEIWQQTKATMIDNILQSGLSLQQLAKKAGVSVSALRNFVGGKTNIMRTTTILKITKALNMKVDDFIGHKDFRK